MNQRANREYDESYGRRIKDIEERQLLEGIPGDDGDDDDDDDGEAAAFREELQKGHRNQPRPHDLDSLTMSTTSTNVPSMPRTLQQVKWGLGSMGWSVILVIGFVE